MKTTSESFDVIYKELIYELINKGDKSVSRKGKKLTELHDKMFMLTKPRQCMATCRNMSLDYLINEFALYMSGSPLLEDALKCSSFWKNCTDDGITVNSNYGKLLFHDKNEKGFTQFEHALNCLKNSRGSKKAVMTIYDKENAYMSNDNPCTMYLKARIDEEMNLHLIAVMRSSDIYYGLPYDVPFFVFVQLALIDQLKNKYPDLKVGTYTHMANSLHYYGYKEEELKQAFEKGTTVDEIISYHDAFNEIVNKCLPGVNRLCGNENFMALAWEASTYSDCLKKRVGACFTLTENEVETSIMAAHGGVASHRAICTHCARENQLDNWYGDECPSIHSEMRAINRIRLAGLNPDWSKVTVYLTHGPCDACCKLMDMVGIKKVFFEVPYKTNYAHWPEMTITQIK